MKQSKTAFILAHPNLSADEVVKEAAKQGMKFSDRYVYSIRSKAKATRGRPRRGPGRPPKGAVVSSSTGGSIERRFLGLAVELGIGRAETLLKNVRGLARG
jgi:hypothetical protein